MSPQTVVSGVVLALCFSAIGRGQGSLLFDHVVVDPAGPRDPWGKAVGDLNGDGAPDLIVGGYVSGGLIWYENPSWSPHAISGLPGFRTDHETGDIDLDGDVDVVSLGSDSSGSPWLGWFKNPGSPDARWVPTAIDAILLHDIELADLDGDGRMDVVGRNQEVFGPGNGDTLFIYLQRSSQRWLKHTLTCANGEGLKVADVNRDALPDIIVNGSWFENAGDGETWSAHEYTSTYTYRSVAVDVADIDGDSRADIVLAPSEPAGGTYRISWLKAPSDPSRPDWVEHVVEDDVETVHHSMAAADFNLDGMMDFASAEMNTGSTSPEVKVFLNGGQGVSWRKRVIGMSGSHGMRAVDVDGDGGMGLFGANWKGQTVDLWINQAETLGVGDPGGLPGDFALAQNYPNPFNPETAIAFQIPTATHVRLIVYDSLGRLIAVLVDGEREPGRYEVLWNAGQAASGLYYYRLEAGSFEQTRRMILLR